MDDGVVAAEEPEAVAGLAFLVHGVVDDWVPRAALDYNEELSRERFQEGGAAFMRNWPYAYALLSSEDSAVRDAFEVARLPGTSVLGGLNLAVSRFSQKKGTALDFIEFITSDEVQRDSYVQGGYPAAVESVYAEPQVQALQPYTAQLADSIRNARARPQTPYYSQVTAAIQRHGHAAISQGADPVRAMEQLAGDLEIALEGEMPVRDG